MGKNNGKGLNNGKYLTHKAEQSDLRVCNGKGDHAVVYAPVGRGYMTIPQRELGKGLACAIRKWLISAGVVFSILLAILIKL